MSWALRSWRAFLHRGEHVTHKIDLTQPISRRPAPVSISKRNQRWRLCMSIDLTVNGEEVQVNSSPDTPLLYVLRGELGLRGPKFGCGLQQCGACSVLTDLGSRRTCVQPVSNFAGQH